MRFALLAALVLLWLLPVPVGRADIADGVLWGGSTHTTKEELGAWLARRGASYGTWADRHPGAAQVLEADVAQPALLEFRTGAPPPVAVSDRQQPNRVPVLALALAAALFAAALLPRAVVPAGLARASQEWRLAVAGGGVAVLVGWIVVVLTAAP